MTDDPKTTDTRAVTGLNRAALQQLIERVRRDSGGRLSWANAREFALTILRHEMVRIEDPGETP